MASKAWAAIAGLAVVLLGCGNPDRAGAPGAGQRCIPGSFILCLCPDESTGTRACTNDGAFGECECANDGPDGSGGTEPGGGGRDGNGGVGGDGVGGVGAAGNEGTGDGGGGSAGSGPGDAGRGGSVPGDPEEGPSPCGEVPLAGRCESSSRAQYCVVPTGQGAPMVLDVACQPWEECRFEDGWAHCALPDDSSCIPGASQCTSPTGIRFCHHSSGWIEATCPSGLCRESFFGATCASGEDTVEFTGALHYELRLPNEGWTDWGEPQVSPAAFVVVALSDGEDFTSFTTTDANGIFTLDVPSRPSEDDQIYFLPIGFSIDGSRIAYAVGHPGSATGVLNPGEVDARDSSIWHWKLQLPAANGEAWVISEAQGSGGLRMFDWLRYTWWKSQLLYEREGLPVILWYGPEITWSCGACFLQAPFTSLDTWDSQIFMPGDHFNSGFWSDPVTMHELGHWSMASFGTPPQEGGSHCIGVPSMPGLAWSEGWATFFSSDLRDHSTSYDKQNGTFFWFDLDLEVSNTGRFYSLPERDLGLIQLMDENWVASSLWRASRALVDSSLFHRALAGVPMRQAPFPRGYTTHRFDVDASCLPTNLENTGRSAPMFADFLDALRCQNIPAAVISSAVTPYPYPAHSPICR